MRWQQINCPEIPRTTFDNADEKLRSVLSTVHLFTRDFNSEAPFVLQKRWLLFIPASAVNERKAFCQLKFRSHLSLKLRQSTFSAFHLRILEWVIRTQNNVCRMNSIPEPFPILFLLESTIIPKRRRKAQIPGAF